MYKKSGFVLGAVFSQAAYAQSSDLSGLSSEANTSLNALDVNALQFEGVQEIPVNIAWQDVLALNIEDPQLLEHVERFLGFIQKTSFHYDIQNPKTGKVDSKVLSGQDLLERIASLQKLYNETGLARELGKKNLMDNGRFVIVSHDRQYTGSVQSGSNTMFIGVGSGQRFPVQIEIGEKYLKGAQQSGIDEKKHPVTVEGVLANELAHLAFASSDDIMSNDIENIIAVPMGAVPRDLDEARTIYFPNINGGYVSLLEIELQKRDRKPSEDMNLEAK